MRKPDFTVGDPNEPYLRRWYVIPRNKYFNIYLHNFLRSDDDRALHDHSYVNASILLRGSYDEHIKDKVKRRYQGSIIFRRAATAHRVELIDDKPVWTLFVTGPRTREWGFHCPKGWVPWQVYASTTPGNSTMGSGCPE